MYDGIGAITIIGMLEKCAMQQYYGSNCHLLQITSWDIRMYDCLNWTTRKFKRQDPTLAYTTKFRPKQSK